MEHNKVMSGLKQTELALFYTTDTSESQSFLKLTLKVRQPPLI